MPLATVKLKLQLNQANQNEVVGNAHYYEEKKNTIIILSFFIHNCIGCKNKQQCSQEFINNKKQ